MLVPAVEARRKDEAAFTEHCDNGGLLYASDNLLSFVQSLENIFTDCFSARKIHRDSILDVLSLIHTKLEKTVGCAVHSSAVTSRVIDFYVVTRLHFLTKGLNRSSTARRIKAKHTKISRCS